MRNVNNEDLKFLALIINKFGTGKHPEATENNLTEFTQQYIAECLSKAFNLSRKNVQK